MKNQKSHFSSIADRFRNIVAVLQKHSVLLILLLIILLVILPYMSFASFLVIRVSVLIMIYATLAIGLNVLTGYTGLVSIGHMLYFGFGAYASALLVKELGLNFFLSLPIVILLTALLGLLTSLPTLRLDGAYLCVATMGFAEVFRIVVMNWDSLTGGVMGLKDIPQISLFGVTFTLDNHLMYYLILAILIGSSLVSYLLIKSKFGRAFISIKEDELAAKLMGINVAYYKGIAFTVSAAITGSAGAYYAHFLRYIDHNTFTLDTSILILSIVILGGLGKMAGMYLGAFVLVLFPQISRPLMEYRFVIYGFVLILFMQFRPKGLLGGEAKGPYKLPKGVVETQEKQ